MKKFCTLAFVVVLFLTSVGTVLAEGWYKTKWGMDQSQVAAAVGEPLTPVNAKFSGDTYTHAISPFKVGSSEFKPYLCFMSGSLKKVHLRYQGANSAKAYAAFAGAKDMMIGKYGAPVGMDNKRMMGGGEIQSAKWVFEDTLITLNYYSMSLPGGASFGANITYEPRTSGGSDKL
jgi:hypothetical protein